MNDELDNEALIANEVSKTIESLDNMPTLSADFRFYNRFEQRIASGEKTNLSFIVRLVFGYRLAYVLLLTIIVANLVTAFMILQDKNSTYSRDEYIESWANQYQDYSLSPFSNINSNE